MSMIRCVWLAINCTAVVVELQYILSSWWLSLISYSHSVFVYLVSFGIWWCLWWKEVCNCMWCV